MDWSPCNCPHGSRQSLPGAEVDVIGVVDQTKLLSVVQTREVVLEVVEDTLNFAASTVGLIANVIQSHLQNGAIVQRAFGHHIGQVILNVIHLQEIRTDSDCLKCTCQKANISAF